MNLSLCLNIAVAVSLLSTLEGCATLSSDLTTDNSQTKLNNAAQSKPIVLLGEVHDNAKQHAMRLIAFQNLLEQGKRPALLMEQFDRDNQGAIDEVRKRPDAGVSDIVAAGSGNKPGWDWNFYKPFLSLAMKYELPIIAANVSNADSMKAMREGLSALKIQATPSAPIVDQQALEIFNGHCKAMPMAVAIKMVNAQVAKDITMAQLVTENQSLGVVLLAGNGHVRNDIGVPHWLSSTVREKSISIGMIEEGQIAINFDTAISTAAQDRGDPCEAFKKR